MRNDHTSKRNTDTPCFEINKRSQLSVVIDWLHAGVEDTHHAGWASLFYGLVFAITGIVIHTLFADNYWLLAGLTTGFFLLGPFLAMGLYDLSRRIEQGQPVSLIPSLTAWAPNVMHIFSFAGVLLAILFIWIYVSLMIFTHFFEGHLPSFTEVVINVITLKQPVFTLIYFSVGGFFAALIYAISVVAMPLMLDTQTSAVKAACTSLRACVRNPLLMLLWAFCIVVLVGVGIATNFLGLIVTMPVVGHASWHVYRDLIKASKLG